MILPVNISALSQSRSSGPTRPSPGEVVRFTNDQVASRLISMGVLPGSKVELIRRAPFGGGWYARIDNQVIALRKEELECIVMK